MSATSHNTDAQSRTTATTNSQHTGNGMLEHLEQLVRDATCPDELARGVAKLLSRAQHVFAAAYLNCGPQGAFVPPLTLVCRSRSPDQAKALEQPLLDVADAAVASRSFAESPVRVAGVESWLTAIAAPARMGTSEAVICMVVPSDESLVQNSKTQLRATVNVLANATSSSEWNREPTSALPGSGHSPPQSPTLPSADVSRHGTGRHGTGQTPRLPDAVSPNGSGPHASPHPMPPDRQDPQSTGWRSRLYDVLGQPTLEAASQQLANALQQRLGMESVFLGIRSPWRQRCPLAAISGVETFHTRSQIVMQASEILDEARIRNRLTIMAVSHEANEATTAMKELAQSVSASHIASGPVHDSQGQLVGAWLGTMAASTTSPPPDVSTLAPVIEQAGTCVGLLRRSRPTLGQRMHQSLFRNGRRRHVLAAVLAVVILVLLCPYPYRVKCSCSVEPLVRRFIPVPYDGVLKSVEVKPGDVVEVDQLLARMDDREIIWELGVQQADYARAKKQHDASLAAGNTGEAQIAGLEMERLALKIQLLKNRIKNLDIRSSLNGIVLSGDPSKREGARLSQGDTLFETGPLQRMLVEVFVPDRDVAYVQPEQSVNIQLDAFPGRTIQGTIERVNPRAESRNQENVFIAEVELENQQSLLRPGMSGRSRITTDHRALGWILFHRAWYALFEL